MCRPLRGTGLSSEGDSLTSEIWIPALHTSPNRAYPSRTALGVRPSRIRVARRCHIDWSLHTYIAPAFLRPVRTVLRRRAPRSPPTSSPPAPPVDTYALPSTVSFAARTDGRHAGASHCATRRPPRGPETVGIRERAGGRRRARDLLRASWRLDPRRPRRCLECPRTRCDRARAAAAAPVRSDPDASHGSRARQRRALAARRLPASRERRRAHVPPCPRAVVMYRASGQRNRAILRVRAHLFASCATGPRAGAVPCTRGMRVVCEWVSGARRGVVREFGRGAVLPARATVVFRVRHGPDGFGIVRRVLA